MTAKSKRSGGTATKTTTSTTDVEQAATTPAEVVTSEPVVEEAPTLAKKGAEPSPEVVAGFEAYNRDMDPKNPMPVEVGKRHQAALRACIINGIMVKDEAVAVANIRFMADYIAENKVRPDGTRGTFYGRHLMRFYDGDQWKTNTDRREIETLLTFMLSTADPKTRYETAKGLDISSLKRRVTPKRAETIVRRFKLAYNI